MAFCDWPNKNILIKKGKINLWMPTSGAVLDPEGGVSIRMFMHVEAILPTPFFANRSFFVFFFVLATSSQMANML